jgi:hypothetical protein
MTTIWNALNRFRLAMEGNGRVNQASDDVGLSSSYVTSEDGDIYRYNDCKYPVWIMESVGINGYFHLLHIFRFSALQESPIELTKSNRKVMNNSSFANHFPNKFINLYLTMEWTRWSHQIFSESGDRMQLRPADRNNSVHQWSRKDKLRDAIDISRKVEWLYFPSCFFVWKLRKAPQSAVRSWQESTFPHFAGLWRFTEIVVGCLCRGGAVELTLG